MVFVSLIWLWVGWFLVSVGLPCLGLTTLTRQAALSCLVTLPLLMRRLDPANRICGKMHRLAGLLARFYLLEC
jgi:hypothetical protein